MSEINVLLVEDNQSDSRLIKEAFAEAKIECSISTVTDGVQAVNFMYKKGEFSDAPQPDVVLLDLKLPKKNGVEVLKELRADDDFAELPIIMLTNSDAKDDILDSYDNFVNSYITKPIVMNELVDVVKYINEMWLSKLDK